MYQWSSDGFLAQGTLWHGLDICAAKLSKFDLSEVVPHILNNSRPFVSNSTHSRKCLNLS